MFQKTFLMWKINETATRNDQQAARLTVLIFRFLYLTMYFAFIKFPNKELLATRELAFVKFKNI